MKCLNTYFVKDEYEKKLINELKINHMIEPGQVKIIDILKKELHNSDLREYNPCEKKKFIIIFDLDIFEKSNCNKEEVKKRILYNINKLKSKKADVIIIVQNRNLKEELINASNINSVTEILNSKSEKDWEKEMLEKTDFFYFLKKVEFDINKLWSSSLPKWLENEYTSKKIKRGEKNVKNNK